MKKSTLENMLSYLNGNATDVDALRSEIQGELDHMTEKARANADLYATAEPVVLAALNTTRRTAKEVYELCKDNLPEDFKAGKVQYLLNHQLRDRIAVNDNGKNPNTYHIK